MESILGIFVSFCPEGTVGLSLGFQPQVSIEKDAALEGAVESVLQIGKTLNKQAAGPKYLWPFQHPQPRGREVQFEHWHSTPILLHSAFLVLRTACPP